MVWWKVLWFKQEGAICYKIYSPLEVLVVKYCAPEDPIDFLELFSEYFCLFRVVGDNSLPEF